MHEEDRAVCGSGVMTRGCGSAACPQGDAVIEPFNGSLRAVCVNVHGFEDLTDARAKMQVWKQKYNEDRPLSRT